MKIIRVHNCIDCPHGAMFDYSIKNYICFLVEKINMLPAKIPGYCPLEDDEKDENK